MKYFFICIVTFVIGISPVHAQVRDIIFPVIGDVSYTDDFNITNPNRRTHHGNDLLGSKLLPLVAAADGTVVFVPYPEPSYGYYVSIQDTEGYYYNYVHINNDTEGTDDGQGGGRLAYAPYIFDGAQVVAGQLIGWMGDSGNAEGTVPHVHFEIRNSDNSAFSPYESLQAAEHISTPVAAPYMDDEIVPYGEFTGGAQIALGNMDLDEDMEIIVGAGPGGGPHVRVFEQDGTPLSSFFAYTEDFIGGVDVAAADLNNDGVDEIITGAGPGRKPRVRVFRADGTFVRGFLAYSSSFHGGISVAAGDIDDDGNAEILVAPGAGRPPLVRAFTRRGARLYGFFAYDESFLGGVDVALYGSTDDQSARIVTAAGAGGGPHIRVFDSAGEPLQQFFAYDESFTGGVRVSIGQLDNDTDRPEIVTVPASDAAAEVRVFNLRGTLLDTHREFEEWWTGGYDVAAREEMIYISSGPEGRRASVRQVAE